MNKIIFFVFLILIPLTFQKNDYEFLLEWGKNNSLEISDKLEMIYISENNKTFYAKEIILKNEIVLKIPHSLSLNIANILKLYGKKGKKLYKEFEFECKKYKKSFICEQIFLSYIMYKVNKNNKKNNNDLYQYYKYLFKTYESDLDNFPIFYNQKQLFLIQFTSLFHSINIMKNMYDGEIQILENDLKLKKIYKDEYYVFRTLASSKSYNISGHSFIIPFVDMFHKHPTKFNLRVLAVENETSIIATRDISASEKLFINYEYLTNQNALTIFGITFEEIIDRINVFHIPILNPLLLKNHKIETKKSDLKKYYTQYMEIEKDNFYKNYIKTYKNIAFNLNNDKTELSALRIMLENIETLKELNSDINYSIISKSFYQQKDIDNIIRIFKGEIQYLNKKINLMRKVINEYENKKSNNNNDL